MDRVLEGFDRQRGGKSNGNHIIVPSACSSAVFSRRRRRGSVVSYPTCRRGQKRKEGVVP